MTTAMITGAAGAIGCHMVAAVMDRTDWDVIAVDSFAHGGDFRRISTVMDERDWGRIRVQRLDLATANLSAANLGTADHIIHLAALSDVAASVADPRRVIDNNISATLNLLDWAACHDHQTFLQFSTDEVYGDVEPGDTRDTWDPHRPSNPYSASKAACEDIAYAYWRNGDLRLVITNTTNNFGEMQGTAKYPTLLQRLIARGEKVSVHCNGDEPGSRYYIHSRHVATAVLHILNYLPVIEHAAGRLDDPAKYHIAGTESVDNLELARLVAKAMGADLNYELVDVPHPGHDLHYSIQPDGVPGWQAPDRFWLDLLDTVRWHMAHPEWLA